MKRVLIIGGYGNFGSTIAKALAGEENLTLIVAGRSLAKAGDFAAKLAAKNQAESVSIDISADIAPVLRAVQPDIVIHTVGPFQRQGYGVVEACIDNGCHYLDLADARDFVVNIALHDAAARARSVLAVSGASSVPCLTAAVIDHYRGQFAKLDKVEYGISAAQQTNRGLATTAAILSYVGKPFSTLIDGRMKPVFGWQDTHRIRYPELGRRLFGNCDIPDLDLFPARYPELKTVRFSAGHEIPIIHLGLWGFSWLVRAGLIGSLESCGDFLLKLSNRFDALGTSRSGFHMFLSGLDERRKPKTVRFYIVARSGHGPYIPCMPAILLTKALANGSLTATGARPCLDLIHLDTYLDALVGLDISVVREVGAKSVI